LKAKELYKLWAYTENIMSMDFELSVL